MDELAAHALRRVPGARLRHAGIRLAYFRAATPIAEIAELNIGSRPASRTASTRIEDLRAIPWVFSWGQCRLMLPGWYGFGAAVDAWLARHPRRARAALREMHARWPFFRSVLSNMAMVLAKTDLAIASRYAELVPDARRARGDLRRASPPSIARTIALVLAITGQATLLDDNPTLARSIRDRFPYLDPLNHLQVELLRRYRARPDRRAHQACDPPHDQRARRGLAQQRLRRCDMVRLGAGAKVTAPTSINSRACPAGTSPAHFTIISVVRNSRHRRASAFACELLAPPCATAASSGLRGCGAAVPAAAPGCDVWALAPAMQAQRRARRLSRRVCWSSSAGPFPEKAGNEAKCAARLDKRARTVERN